jgi:hypothetical protein
VLDLDPKSCSFPLLLLLIVSTGGRGAMLDTNMSNISVNPAPNTTDDADVSARNNATIHAGIDVKIREEHDTHAIPAESTGGLPC